MLIDFCFQETSQGTVPEEEEEQPKPRRTKKLTPEEIQEKRRLRKEKNQKLESCLILTRAYYAQHEKAFNDYIDSHTSCVYTGEEMKLKKQAKVNKNVLLSKINANMLIQCEDNISKEQVLELQKFKEDANSFQSKRDGYR